MEESSYDHETTTMIPKLSLEIALNLDPTNDLSDSDHQMAERESAETETESCTETSPEEACADAEHTKSSNSCSDHQITESAETETKLCAKISPEEACTDGEHTKNSNSDSDHQMTEEESAETETELCDETSPAEAGTDVEHTSDYGDYASSYEGDEDQYNDHSYDSFEATYYCHSLSLVGKSHLEDGSQIVMPASSLEKLLQTQVVYPMLFEIRNESKGKVSHCGVSEFTAEEGTVFLPSWMMDNLKLQDGQPVNLKNASLPRATFVKLQPHSVDFLLIRNPKAALEEALSAMFFCLTTGDTIKIRYNFKDFYIDVVETKPSAAVCIIDTDCEVDFAPPLDYIEPEKTEEEPTSTNDLTFKPFTGVARRLDDPAAETATPGSTPVEENQTIDAGRNAAPESEFKASRSTGKLVFGSSGRKLKNIEKDSKAETPEEKRFQPFSGKKYSLSS